LIKIEDLEKPGIGLDKLMDLNELIIIKNENEWRSIKAEKNAREGK